MRPTFHSYGSFQRVVSKDGVVAGFHYSGNFKTRSKEDVDGDGLLDLVVHVETEGLELTDGDTEAVLQGKTFDGVSVRGSDSVRIVAALHVADGPGTAGSFDGLSRGSLQSVIDQTVSFWASTGLDSQELNLLSQLDVQIADLPGSLLGLAAANSIWIDRDAAGYGWSVTSGGVDLFSAVTHEFGHVLGFRHDVMGKTLGVRVRQLASSSFSTGFGSLRNVELSARFDGFLSLSGGQDLFDTFSATSFTTYTTYTTYQDDSIWTTTTLDQPFETLLLLFDHERPFRIVDAKDDESDLMAEAAGLQFRRATESEEFDHLFAEFQESLAEAI